MFRRYPMHVRSCAALALSVLVLVTMTASAVNRAVICLGADGHLTIETAVNGQCSDAAAVSTSTSVALLLESDSHCGPCTDVPYDSGLGESASSVQRMQRSAQTHAVAALLPSSVSDGTTAGATAPLYAQSVGSLGDQPRLHLATVVLLT